ncbi:MAG TPA: hypothetical protein VK105_12415 [Virgibacillus sp.]|nr:hypothetical protein [Virgibacillus sp.]HLR67909.1 hypothetical protein [Virgibacillus sp.]
MNYNQIIKIAHITPSILIVGINIAKGKLFILFQDDQGMEFDNRIHGFQH